MFMAVLNCLTLYWNWLKFSYRTLARQLSVTIELKDTIIRMKSLFFILVFTNPASVMCLEVCWLVGQGFRNRRKHAFPALLDWTISRAQSMIRKWDRVLLCRKNLPAFERVSVCRGGNHCQVTYILICCTQLMIAAQCVSEGFRGFWRGVCEVGLGWNWTLWVFYSVCRQHGSAGGVCPQLLWGSKQRGERRTFLPN